MEAALLLRYLSSFVLSCTLVCAHFDPDSIRSFYEDFISEGRAQLPGLATPATVNTTSPLSRFTAQQFMLWDYLFHVDEYETHFEELTTLCTRRKIQRVIMFIPDPNTFSFFDPSNADGFIAKANALAAAMEGVVSSFELAVFFETGAFTSSAAAGTVPTVNPLPSTELAGYFSDLQNMLDWSKAMHAAIPSLAEITFDPEAAGANKNIQQLVYNYSDEYKWLNNLDDIRLGTTVGIDESKIAYANVSSFPVNAVYGGNITTFPANPQPSWDRGGEETSPLLQSVYIQCYEEAIPALFARGYAPSSGRHNGITAGAYFNKLLRDQPYIQGKGKITFTRHETEVTGAGTEFSSFSDPILFAYDSQIKDDNKIGVVESTGSNTSLTLGAPGAAFSGDAEKFERTEITTAWDTQLDLTQDMVNSIYWMFSLNYTPPLSFFGNWQLGDFMDFIETIQSKSNAASTAVFFDANGRVLPIPLRNYVIYQYFFATNTVQTTPTSNGAVAPWNLLSAE